MCVRGFSPLRFFDNQGKYRMANEDTIDVSKMSDADLLAAVNEIKAQKVKASAAGKAWRLANPKSEADKVKARAASAEYARRRKVYRANVTIEFAKRAAKAQAKADKAAAATSK